MKEHTAHMKNEIHLKIGGDHGGNSFKYAYQIANLEKPNSVDNSVVFNIFEAKDSRSNLDLTSHQISTEIDELQTIRVL